MDPRGSGKRREGRIEGKTQTVGGSPVNFVVQYRYDSGGRLDKITYPSGREVTMGFDSVGRVASVTEGDLSR